MAARKTTQESGSAINIPTSLLGTLLSVILGAGATYVALTNELTKMKTEHEITSKQIDVDLSSIKAKQESLELKTETNLKQTKTEFTSLIKEMTSNSNEQFKDIIGKLEYNSAQNKNEISEIKDKIESLSSTISDMYSQQMRKSK